MAFALQPRPAATPLGTETHGGFGSVACDPPVAFLQEMDGLNLGHEINGKVFNP